MSFHLIYITNVNKCLNGIGNIWVAGILNKCHPSLPQFQNWNSPKFCLTEAYSFHLHWLYHKAHQSLGNHHPYRHTCEDQRVRMVVHWARVCDTHTLVVGQICPAWSHKTHSAVSGIKNCSMRNSFLWNMQIIKDLTQWSVHMKSMKQASTSLINLIWKDHKFKTVYHMTL